MIASWLPFLTFIFSFFSVLVHEMGHAISGWLFGYPSIPSFDFFYGGGVTIREERILAISILVCALFVLAAVIWRRNSVILIGSAIGLTIYSALAFTIWHEALMIAMGHGTELVIAAIFLYRAMSGHSIIRTSERPVYAFLGFFIVIYNVVFDYKLITNTSFRLDYEYAKGDMQMDYSQLASGYLSTNVMTVAKIFLVLALATPFLALAIHMVRFRREHG